MGLFKDAFGIGAGATLGSLSAQTGYTAATNLISAAGNKLYTQFRSENFDPVVRQDFCDILVRGGLAAREYPFPTNEVERRDNFFVRHKKFLIITGICFVVSPILSYFSDDIGRFVAIAYVLYFYLYAAAAFGKKLQRGTKKLAHAPFKSRLIEDGKNYWYIREYVRQALLSGELNVENAIVKLSHTELVNQFPDTVDQIEASAFYYRQRLEDRNIYNG